MNGFEAARALRDLMPSVPISMFTLYDDEFMREKARLVGVTEVVSKTDNISVPMQTARRLLYGDAA
jgi:DNA-binding NarL/FixJ family response regulator